MDKQFYEDRMESIRQQGQAVAERDELSAVGSNEPLASDRVRAALLASAEPMGRQEIINACRKAGYVGPDTRIIFGIRRLLETKEIRQEHQEYSLVERR